MKRVQFRIDFARIIYKLQSRKDFTVRLSLEDKEGSKISSHEVAIGREQDVVDLDGASMELYLVGRERRSSYLPFNLYFTVQTVPSIRRKVQLNLERISSHYFEERYRSTALEQIYSFEEGEIIYIVTVLNATTITNQAEAATYDKHINRESSAKKIEEDFEAVFQKRSLTPTTTLVQSEDGSKITENTKLQIGETNSECEETSERGKDGEYWGDLDDEQDGHNIIMGSQIGVKEPSSLPIKLILVLLVLGLIALVVDICQDPSMSDAQRKRTKKKAEAKEKRRSEKKGKVKH